jgi:hypothetical protein
MGIDYIEIRVGGKTIKVPSTRIRDRRIIVTGKWTKIAAVQDEDFTEDEAVDDPEVFITMLKEGQLKADIFTFAQKLPEVTPRYGYHLEWENVAAIPITSFTEWWNNRVSTHLRKDVRRAQKRGVIVRLVEFNDQFVRGIMEIYNETPVRQGRAFWHYGKDFDTVKRETITYLERSDFLGAYFGEELIGFIKIVYVGDLACLMQIISKTEHYDKRPANALIARAIEVCDTKACTYLTYGKYTYGKRIKSSLIDFKRRNGFEEIYLPRYYIPLTSKGKIVLRLKLHHGIRGILPESVLSVLRNARSSFYRGPYVTS